MKKKDELSKDMLKDWVRRRVDAVQIKYTAYDALSDIGAEGIVDEDTDVSIFCPFHDNTKTPAARYYAPQGNKPGYLRCYGACKCNRRSIDIFGATQNLRFMDALVTLERRFRIQVPQRPELPDWIEPTERGANYESEQWKDIPRVLKLLESKLMRVKPKCTLIEFTKICRVIDNVHFDIEKDPKVTPAMVEVTGKAMKMMDDISAVHDMADSMSFDELSNPL